jgi:MFS family permease
VPKLAISKSDKSLSLLALDWLNFFLSSMRGGIGPYMVIYFSHINFSASQIGSIIATLAISNAVAHIPAGQLVDKSKHRRELIALAMLLIMSCILSIMYCHDFKIVLLIQVIIGIASALIPPALGALSLGLVGHNGIAARLGRNDAFNHAGNVTVAILVGIGGLFITIDNLLLLFVIICIVSIIVVFLIRYKDINESWAKGIATEGAQTKESISLKILLTNRVLLTFLVAVLTFHLTNSALLPIVIQKIIKICPVITKQTIPLWSSSCILMAELVMIFSAVLAGKMAKKGRKNLFLACYLLVALRALIFAIIMQPPLLVCAQFLDGLSAGIYGVIGLTMLSDIVYGSGRFNLSQGFFNAFTAVGIAASNYLAGVLIDNLGFSSTCVIACLTTLISFAFIAKLMPETKDRKSNFNQISAT